MVALFLVFYGISILFSRVAVSASVPTKSARGLPFLHTLQHLLFVNFWMTAILTLVEWYITVVLICSPLIMSNIEHLFMCFLAICRSSLEKCLFRSSVHLLIELIIFLVLSCTSCLYILEISSLSVVPFAIFFFCTEGCLFTLHIVSFVVQKLLSYLGLIYFCCSVLWVLTMFLHLLDVSLSFCFV